MNNPKVIECAGEHALVRNTFAQFPSGVAVLAVEDRGEKHALVVSSFMVGVSLEPILVATAVQKTSETWPRIRSAASIGVSVFGDGQGGLTRKLASRDRASRFTGVTFEISDQGALLLDDAALWLETSVHSISDAGDHWMVLLEVNKLGIGTVEPLVWHGAKFRGLLPEMALAAAD